MAYKQIKASASFWGRHGGAWAWQTAWFPH